MKQKIFIILIGFMIMITSGYTAEFIEQKALEVIEDDVRFEYYEDGSLHVERHYDENNQLLLELMYDRGEQDWWKKEEYKYYSNGNLKSEYLYDQKIKQGYHKSYYENGYMSLGYVMSDGQLLACRNYDDEAHFLSSVCPDQE